MESYVGVVLLFAGSFPPQNFELCRGQELSINQYAALCAVIGDTYGGDLQKGTFKLPNLEGPESSDPKTKLNYIICIQGQFPMRP